VLKDINPPASLKGLNEKKCFQKLEFAIAKPKAIENS